MAEAQWVRRWSSDHRVVQAEGSSPSGDTYQTFFSGMIFISVFLGLIDSEIVMLRGGPNSCCQQNLNGQLQRFHKLSLFDRFRHVENDLDINF